MSDFAERLKELRIEKNLAMEKLANETGISSSAINTWENRISFPTLPSLIVLAKFFKVTLDFLAGLEN